MKDSKWKDFIEYLLKKNNSKEHVQTDFVLVYKKDGRQNAEQARSEFFKSLLSQGVIIKESVFDNKVFVEIHIPLHLLCVEGDRAGLRVPSYLTSGYEDLVREGFPYCSFLRNFYSERFVDKMSVPLRMDTLKMWESNNQLSQLFRPATRILLAYLILNAVDLSEEAGENFVMNNEDKYLSRKKGLNHMLMKKHFIDAFPLHDEASASPADESTLDFEEKANGATTALERSSSTIKIIQQVEWKDVCYSRNKLYKAWMKFFKFQPINMIREYFGEKVALYFAWCDVLLISLCFPMVFGVITFIYGLVLNIRRVNSNYGNSTNRQPVSPLEVVKESFDNELMLVYAIIITIWGTLFLEIWKRQNATLAYMWDVDSFEDNEPDRPQYTDKKAYSKFTPLNWLWVRCSVSIGTMIFMVCLVFIITAALILYRVVMTIDFCQGSPTTNCFLVSVVVTTVLNSIGIIVLNKVYQWVAVKLTNWENYRTQTEFDDALILKLFAFEFANSYSTCFYIAFFRGGNIPGGVFGVGNKYQDSCGDETIISCMPMLSFQILTLMVLKPFPKFFQDLVVPILKNFYRKCSNKVRNSSGHSLSGDEDAQTASFIEKESSKVPLGDFTLPEYTEKIILYGYLMLFAASFPLGPLFTMVTLMIDYRLDARRLLFINRRPVPYISQDIGRWYDILNFINVTGVVVNACLVAFTSHWGSKYSGAKKLIIVLIFENVVFAIKYLIAIIIPDVPASVRNAKRRDVFKYEKLLAEINKCPEEAGKRLLSRDSTVL